MPCAPSRSASSADRAGTRRRRAHPRRRRPAPRGARPGPRAGVRPFARARARPRGGPPCKAAALRLRGHGQTIDVAPPPVPPADHAPDDRARLNGDEKPVAVLAPDEPQELLERVGRARDRSRAPPEGEHRLTLLGAARSDRDRARWLLALDHEADSVALPTPLRLTCCAHAVIVATCPG